MTEEKKIYILKECNKSCKDSLLETLSMKFVDVGDDFLTAKMPVNSRVHQPDGVLHGGATVALAETVGSVASFVFQRNKNVKVRGLEISANHVKSIIEGTLFATARAIHMGRTTQVWEILVTDQNTSLISHCKLTTITLNESKK